MKEKSYIKSLQIIFIAIGIGQLMLAFVFLIDQKETYFSFKEDINPLHFMAPIFAVSAILISEIFFKQSIKQLKKKELLGLKLNGFKTALIVKLAILEGAAIISVIGFSINGNLYFMMIFGVMLAFYIIQFPTAQKTIKALELNDEDVTFLN